MALVRSRRADNRVDYWPGFVDALATLLLAIIGPVGGTAAERPGPVLL